MLSPTLALRCPHCQHALALADIRGASTCPACGQVHGLPPAVADALALYERAIQQAVSDLVHSAPVPADSPGDDAQIAPQTTRTYARNEPGPSARLLGAPVHPNTLLSIGPAPAPRAGGSSGHAAKDSLALAGETLRAPVTTPGPATLSGRLAVDQALAPPGDPLHTTAELVSGRHVPSVSREPDRRRGAELGSDRHVPSASREADRRQGAELVSVRRDPGVVVAPVSSDSPTGAPSPTDPAARPVPSTSPHVGSGLSRPSAGGLAHPASERSAPLPQPVDPPVAAESPSPDAPVPSDSPAFDPAALSGPLPAPAPVFLDNLRLDAAARASGDTLPGAPVNPSNSSLLSILYNRSGASLSTPSTGSGLAAPPGGLAEAPLLVAAVREPVDGPPARQTAELVAAVRSFLPDRPDTAEPEREGRIPAHALAIARRALLARHADERRQQQIGDSNLGLFFAAVVSVGLLLFGLWYVAAPIAVIAILFRLRREERGERFGAEVQRLADALGGTRLPSYDAIAAWFDRLWPAPVSPEAMWTSHMHGAVRCPVHGYSTLVDVHLNEKTAGGVVYPPRITAYLAAIWPGRIPSLRSTATDLPPAAQARLTRLRKAGYTVVADANGGLVMRASENIAQAARSDITRLPALQVPINELADLARDLGAEPVAAP